jgi:hypothetical protein
LYKNRVKIDAKRLSWKMRFVLFFAIVLAPKAAQESSKIRPKAAKTCPEPLKS